MRFGSRATGASAITREIMELLGLCGSLRPQSSNLAMLRAYASRCAGRAAFTWYDGLAALPAFNPDADVEPLPAAVARLRALVGAADAVVISTPEYAHALPGALKNALDWLVSDPAFMGKPVVILHAVRGSTWALDSLGEVLRTMSADLREIVALPLGSNAVGAEQILARPDLRALIDASIAALLPPPRRTEADAGRPN